MQRTIIIASHHRLAEGMTDTLKYIINSGCSIKNLNGYMNNVSIGKDVQKLMSNVHNQDEIFVFTDILAGSVNQAFMALYEFTYSFNYGYEFTANNELCIRP